jgi:hypothetical protein
MYIFETFVLHGLKNIAVNMQVDKFGFMESRVAENDGLWRKQKCTSFI